MSLYIKNKSINCNKVNDVTDLKSIDDAVWNFISVLYKSEWNSFIADKDICSFRQTFVAKFTLKLHKINMYSKNKNHVGKPASFVKLFSFIPVKFLKEA